MADNRFDETAFHTLWADGLDPLTSAVASIVDDGEDVLPASRSHQGRKYFGYGMLAGLTIWFVWQLLF